MLTSTRKVPLTDQPRDEERRFPLDSKITLHAEKDRLRTEVLARREALPGREERSARIHARLLARPEWADAGSVCTFVGVKSEVSTLPLIEAAFAAGKRVSVPVVEGDSLTLVRIDAIDELVPAPFGLLEPKRELRRKGRRLVATTVRLFLVPGLAFDRQGGRLGHGKGYYDRLLARVKPTVPTIALAFDTQVVPEVPMSTDDRRISMVITESEEILCVPVAARRPKL